MRTFDLINGEGFRRTLEADYRELELAMNAGAWKAVHVLAGSIIEAVLLDYLVSSGYQSRNPKEDPLSMSLSKLITACRSEKVLSERTEQLSQVIRGYRNLIHPARVEREKETVSEDGAYIARSLVNMIIEEVSTRKSVSYGYTAEQILTKIERDSSTVAILEHLLQDTNEQERNRLLKMIPEKYISIFIGIESVDSTVLHSLESCFRVIYGKMSDDVKKAVAKDLIKIIKEESQRVAYIYETVFFRIDDLVYFSFEDARLIKQHLFSALSKQVRNALLDALQGVGKYLLVDEVALFIEPFIRVLTSNELEDAPLKRIPSFLKSELEVMEVSVAKEVENVFDKWIAFYRDRYRGQQAQELAELWDYIEFLPF